MLMNSRYIVFAIVQTRINKICYISSSLFKYYSTTITAHRVTSEKINSMWYIPLYDYINVNGGWDMFDFRMLYLSEKRLSKDEQTEVENKYIDLYQPEYNHENAYTPKKGMIEANKLSRSCRRKLLKINNNKI